MSKVFQPVGIKKLTNIAVVRYKRHGHRFEIACYKNKVLNWRNGVEKDIDEVLQTTAIFSNVSKGILAKREDLLEAFGTDDEMTICLKILAEGELQVSDKERKVEFDNLFRDVASILSEKCINPETNRPYTISMIERALKDVHFSVDPKRPAKSQALEALPILQKRFPIERARMRLKIQVPLSSKDEVMDLLQPRQAAVEEQDLAGSMFSIVCLLEPGWFRAAHALVQSCSGRMEVVSLAATTEDSELKSGMEALTLGSSKQQPQLVNLDIDHSAPAVGPSPPIPATVAAAPQLQSTVGGSSGLSSMPGPRRAAPAVEPSAQVVLYPRGPIAGLPEEHASRRERFAELDELQPGWTVELTCRAAGAAVEAVLYAPDGQKIGTFAAARRLALAASKK